MEDEADVQLIGTATTEAEAVAWLEENPGAWDLLVVDLFLQEGSGLGIVKRCGKCRPGQRVVVLTNYATGEIADWARELGADAVFDKAADLEASSRCAPASTRRRASAAASRWRRSNHERRRPPSCPLPTCCVRCAPPPTRCTRRSTASLPIAREDASLADYAAHLRALAPVAGVGAAGAGRRRRPGPGRVARRTERRLAALACSTWKTPAAPPSAHRALRCRLDAEIAWPTARATPPSPGAWPMCSKARSSAARPCSSASARAWRRTRCATSSRSMRPKAWPRNGRTSSPSWPRRCATRPRWTRPSAARWPASKP
jgi:two-component system OmpR family response regulator